MAATLTPDERQTLVETLEKILTDRDSLIAHLRRIVAKPCPATVADPDDRAWFDRVFHGTERLSGLSDDELIALNRDPITLVLLSTALKIDHYPAWDAPFAEVGRTLAAAGELEDPTWEGLAELASQAGAAALIPMLLVQAVALDIGEGADPLGRPIRFERAVAVPTEPGRPDRIVTLRALGPRKSHPGAWVLILPALTATPGPASLEAELAGRDGRVLRGSMAIDFDPDGTRIELPWDDPVAFLSAGSVGGATLRVHLGREGRPILEFAATLAASWLTRETFEEWVRTDLPALRGRLRRSIPHEADREDAMMDALTKLFQKIDGGGTLFDSAENFARFVFRTAMNVYIDKKRIKRERTNQASGGPDRPSPEAGLELTTIRKGLVDGFGATTHECLERLSGHQQRLIELLYIEDATIGEIASQLGMTSGLVRVHKHRVLEKLMRCLTERGVDPKDWDLF